MAYIKSVNNRNIGTRASQIRQQREYDIAEAKRIEEEKRLEEKKKNASVWERIGDTIWDFGANLFGGASKSVEGVVDAGSAIVGNVAGWFGANDFKKQMERNIAYDWTAENILNPANAVTDVSLLNDSQFGKAVEEVASGVGQLLPHVVLTVATGGASLGASTSAKVASGLSKAYLFSSAMGNSTETALNEGADLGQATGYGFLSGGVELISEHISGKMFGENTIDKSKGIKGFIGKSFFKASESGAIRMAQEAVGEGIEEAFAEVMNPLLKRWTYDPDAKLATFDEVLESAVVGSFTSIAFGATIGKGLEQLPSFKNAKRLADIQTQILDYNKDYEKFATDASTGKLNGEQMLAKSQELQTRKTQLDINIADSLSKFKEGMKFSEKSRQSFNKQAMDFINSQDQFKNSFNADGSVAKQTQTDITKTPYNVLASPETANQVAMMNDIKANSNIQAMSVDLIGKESKIQFKPTSKPLTQEIKNVLPILNDLSKAKGHIQSYVVVAPENMPNNSRGAYVDSSGVIYIRENLTATEALKEVGQATIVHEFSHSIENTDTYKDLTDFVLKNLDEKLHHYCEKKMG